MKKALLIVLAIGMISFTTVARAQNSTMLASNTAKETASIPSAAPAVSKENWGKIAGEADARAYTSNDGSVTYKIGDKIHVGIASSRDNQFQYITFKALKSKSKFLKALLSNSASPLEKQYEDQLYTITDMYVGLANVEDALLKDAPKRTYIVISVSKNNNYEIAIEPALISKEVIPSN